MNFGIPLFKAKIVDKDEKIIGFLIDEDKIRINEKCFTTQMSAIQLAKDIKWFKIDPSTLEISFDNGKSWEKLTEVSEIIDDHGVNHLKGCVEFSDSYN